MSYYFPDALDVLSDICRETGGAEFVVLTGAEKRGWKYSDGKPKSFDPLGQMNHHTAAGRWTPLTNFIAWGHQYSPLANGMTSNPYETDGKVIVQVIALGRANHAGLGIWLPDVPRNSGNGLLWGWEHQHSGLARDPWHPLHREVILRLNVGMNLAFGWRAHNVPDHKDYAPGRKPDRVHENGDAWRELIQTRTSVGHHSGHEQKGRTVKVTRLAGGTWFGTAEKMVRTRYAPGDTPVMYIVVRQSEEASRVAAMGAPWAEVTRDGVPKETAALIRHFKPTELVPLGGPRTLPQSVVDECTRIAEGA